LFYKLLPRNRDKKEFELNECKAEFAPTFKVMIQARFSAQSNLASTGKKGRFDLVGTS
jgi:hypothetical protein